MDDLKKKKNIKSYRPENFNKQKQQLNGQALTFMTSEYQKNRRKGWGQKAYKIIMADIFLSLKDVILQMKELNGPLIR